MFVLVVSPVSASGAIDHIADVNTDVDANADDLVPGAGRTLVMARPTWDTGWFQAEVLARVLAELGYLIDGPVTYDNESFYRDVEDGTVDLWANGWFPLHERFLPGTRSDGAEAVGYEVEGGALQGYAADIASVDEFGITSLADLADPAIAAVFDGDGDGKADLIGCNRDWACHDLIEHQLEAFDLTGTVEQVSAEYGPLMEAAARRHVDGRPVLYYNFTPNWTNGVMVPGRDVVWLPVPFSSLPDELADEADGGVVAGIAGCLDDPCNMGFPPNDIRTVANRRLLADEPAVAELLERFSIPLDDIAEQNARMFRGEDAESDIETHAEEWLDRQRDTVDRWLEAATRAHVAAGRALGPRPARAGTDEIAVESIRVVTRPAAPYVVYDGGRYGGFTIELLELIADEAGVEIEISGVTSNAKLIDDVARGEADVGAGAIAVTSERERRVDFSQAYMESGLEIMVPKSGSSALRRVVGIFVSRDVLLVIGTLVLALVIAAHVVWLAERRTNPEFPSAYGEGIWEAFWWAAVTATTVGYGDKTPKGFVGRIVGLFWMFVGLFLLAYFTAGIASAVAVQEVEGRIQGPADLRAAEVGVVTGSLADDHLGLQGIAATEYATADDAYRALVDGSIEAVVHDAAILQHHLTDTGRDDLHLVGPVFARRGLAFAVDSSTDIDEALNRGLIEVIESGRYDELQTRWFGEPEDR